MNVLLVSYYAPPTSTPRAVRLANLVQALVRRGHRVQVLTSVNTGKDTLNLKKLVGSDLVEVPLGPFGRAQLRGSARSTSDSGAPAPKWKAKLKGIAHGLLFPEWQSEWVFQAQAVIPKLGRPDRVVSLVAPFSGAILGTKLAKKYGVPHIVDYGDPWSHSVDRGLNWRRPLDRLAEKRVISGARALVVNADLHADRLREVFPSAPEVGCFWNGYDPTDFSTNNVEVGTEFRHVGQLYSARLSLEPLFQVLPEFPGLFPLHQVGPSFGDQPSELIVHPAVSFAESLRQMQTAKALCLLGSPGDFQLPSKIFHYVGSGRPFLIVVGGERHAYSSLPLGDRAVVAQNTPEALRDGLKQLTERVGKSYPPLAEFFAETIMDRYVTAIEGWA